MDSERDADTEQAERVRAAGEAEPAAALDRSRAAVRAALFGQTVAPLRIGRYVVLATLGQGGMGVVYRAWDPELDRNVALKLVQLDGRPVRTARARARLLREGQAMAKLAHPNVVPVFDAGTVGDDVFIAMEHVDGVTLREWLRRGPPSRREILRVMIDAARGLAAAHRAGVVHRDFKPANVLVGRDGRARVLDFGLARALEQPESSSESDWPRVGRGRDDAEITELGQVVGTPAYIAPERMGGAAGDERADQYAFGVTLYEALAARHPFPAPPGVELRAFLATAPLQPPPRIAGVGARLQRTVARLLAADPAARFADMDQVIAELSRDPMARLRRAAVVVLALSLALVLGLQLWSLSRPGHVRPVATAAGQPVALAQLEVDGQLQVLSSDGTLALSPGLHRIALALPEHRRTEVIVEVVRGATLELPLALEHEQGLLEIDVEPRGATIVIDGVEHGSPLRGHRVDTGHHTLWVRQLGWYERKLEVDVAVDQTARAFASLSPGLAWSEPETGVNAELLWLGDADGDGRPELAHRNFNRVRAFDPWHGRRVWSVSFGNNQGERSAWGDLDGDGVQDLVVAWHVDAQRLVAAWSGRSAGDDPAPRWRREHGLGEGEVTPLRGPLVLQLDGDARPELLLAGRTGAEVEILGGDDGRTLASLALADAPLGLAALPAGATAAAVVLDRRALWGVGAAGLRRIVDAPADADARTPVVVRAQGGPAVALHGAAGWSVHGLDGALRWRGQGDWLTALDVDGDGRDEVLLREGDRVVLHDDDGAARWTMAAAQFRGAAAWHDAAIVLRQDDAGAAVLAADTLALRFALAGTRGRVDLGAPVDWDGDGTRELAVVDDVGVTAFDARGRRRESVALEVRPERIASTADANGDRSDDLLLEARGPMLLLGPRILWRRRSTDAIRAAPVAADLDRDGTLELALFGGIGGAEVVLTVLDASTGMVESRGEVGGSAVIRPPLLDRDGGAPSLLHVVGNELVRFGADAQVLARVAAGGSGYASPGWVGSGATRALAWIDWSGRLSRWEPETLQRELAVELGAGSWSPPLELATASGTLWIVSLLDGTLRALDPEDGSERWRVALGARNAFAPLLADVDGDGAPELVTVAGAGVDRRDRPQDLVGISPEHGEERWRIADVGWSRSRPVWLPRAEGDGGVIVFATRDGKVIARGFDGRERWRFDVGAAVDASTALVRADLEHDGRDEVIAGFADGRVRVLDGERGSLRWGFDANDEIEAPPLPIDVDGDGIDELLVGSHDRAVSCLRHLR